MNQRSGPSLAWDLLPLGATKEARRQAGRPPRRLGEPQANLSKPDARAMRSGALRLAVLRLRTGALPPTRWLGLLLLAVLARLSRRAAKQGGRRVWTDWRG